jgi:eukaryotic-like serine/threonine-protein kinase
VARLGRYEIIKTLAKGALTDLHIGRASGMEGFQRYVAIKRLLPEYASDPACIEAFVSEARLAAVLHHHNIVQVHDIGDVNGRPYFAMEYVHGVDLRTLLGRLAKRNEQLPLQHVVSIVASAAAALHHAHEQHGPDGEPLGIVHRDVTPANILVGYDGNVKVVDFGIAKAAIKQMQSDAGVIKGQAPYMSPEQCAGKAIDRRSDVFALGVVLYELATVRRLFKGPSDFLTMSAIVNAEVPRPSQYRRDIPPQLEAIMLKALARDPRERFQTAGEMSLALDQVASQVGVGASTTALANYMRLQFGDQKEPWLKPTPTFDDETTDVDFDGGASGLAPPPSEAVEKMVIPRVAGASKSSPIAAARSHAITPASVEKTRLPLPPPRLKGSTQPPPVRPHAALDRIDDLHDVDPHGPTDFVPVVRPVVRPSGGIPRMTPHDATALVQPLPPTGPQYVVPRHRSSRPLWLMLFAIVVGSGSVAAVVLWPGGHVAPTTAPDPESSATADPPVPPAPAVPDSEPAPPQVETPATAPEPAANPPSKSAMEMTYADYERERAKQAEDDAAADAAAAERTSEIKPEPKDRAEPIAKTSTPPKRTTVKAPPKRTVAKASAAAAKKVKPPAKKPATKTWNPDDLFLDDK